MLVQYALGDRVVPNPTTATLVRAGELGDRTVLVRTDRVARAAGAEWPDPHGFLLAVRAPGLIGRVALLAQEQLARFLRDEGEALWAPSGLSSSGPDDRYLETPERRADERARGRRRAALLKARGGVRYNGGVHRAPCAASAGAPSDPEPARAP